MVKPGDLNGRKTLFGGRMLEWIDEEAAIFAACQLDNTNVVTKTISEVDFVQTAHIGDIVEIGMDVVKFGTTSITICCDVRNKNTKNTIVKIDKIVFVLLDENDRPTPHGKTKVKR